MFVSSAKYQMKIVSNSSLVDWILQGRYDVLPAILVSCTTFRPPCMLQPRSVKLKRKAGGSIASFWSQHRSDRPEGPPKIKPPFVLAGSRPQCYLWIFAFALSRKCHFGWDSSSLDRKCRVPGSCRVQFPNLQASIHTFFKMHISHAELLFTGLLWWRIDSRLNNKL